VQEAADAARSLAWLHWAVHVAFGQAAGRHLLPVLARGGSAKVRPLRCCTMWQGVACAGCHALC